MLIIAGAGTESGGLKIGDNGKMGVGKAFKSKSVCGIELSRNGWGLSFSFLYLFPPGMLTY